MMMLINILMILTKDVAKASYLDIKQYICFATRYKSLIDTINISLLLIPQYHTTDLRTMNIIILLYYAIRKPHPLIKLIGSRKINPSIRGNIIFFNVCY